MATISTIVAEETAKSDPSLQPFTTSFDGLLNDYKDEYASLALDEVIVGAIGQAVL